MRLLKSNSHHKSSRESGATFVEYAIVFPLIFFLFLSFMDFGRWYYYRGLATAAAQRGVSLTQLISGFEDLTMDDIMDPTEKFGVTDHNDSTFKRTVMGGITHKVGNFIEDRVGIQITDDPGGYVKIKPATTAFPLVKVPTWDENAGESLAEKLESEPIEVQFVLVMDTFSPWLPEFETEITAAAFYEEAKKSSIPVPVNCNAERITEFDAADPADCRCKDGLSVYDPVANACVCEAGATYNAGTDSCDCDVGDFDPSAGANGECVCDPGDCDPSTQTQNDITDANPCACVCIDAGGGDAGVVDDGAGGCGCPGSDLQYSGNTCVCPPEPGSPNDCETLQPGSNWGYDPGTQTCKCINCPTGEQPDGSGGCECQSAGDLGCADGATVNADCDCECPSGERDIDGICCPWSEYNSDDVCCPLGQTADGAGGCRCPDLGEQDEIDEVCPGTTRYLEGACACANCPTGMQATDNNQGCYCPFTQNSDGSDITGLCTGADEFLDPAVDCPSGCRTCPGAREVNDARDDCYCPLVENGDGTPVDPSSVCTGVNERIRASQCDCHDCPNSRVANAANTGCECPEGTNQSEIDAVCNNNPNQVWNGACGCKNCPAPLGPLNNNRDCYCPYTGDANGNATPELTCSDTQILDVDACECVDCPDHPDFGSGSSSDGSGGCNCPATSNGTNLDPCNGGDEYLDGCECVTCPGTYDEANGANNDCTCPIDATFCRDENNGTVDITNCDCIACPSGQSPNAAGDDCVCDNTCSITGQDANEDNSCTCECPTAQVVFDNACVRDCCVGAGDTWVCDVDGRCPGESGYKGPHNPE